MIQFISSSKFDKEISLIFISEEQIVKDRLGHLPSDIRKETLKLSKIGQFKGKSNELYPVLHKNGVIVLSGLGKEKEFSGTLFRIAVRKAFLSSYLKDAKSVEVIPHEDDEAVIVPLIEGFLIGAYEWKKYKSSAAGDISLNDKNIFIAAKKKNVYADAIAVCDGVNFARDLVNDNADVITSDHFEKTIRQLVKGQENISLEVLDKKAMKDKGLGLHLAVNQGSLNEPKLIIVKYHGSPSKGDYTALIGKGITFDTGGINLKPTGHVETMRCDMSGAAAVVGTLKNAIELKLKKNIIFAVGLAENAIDAASYKPGDVFKGYAGKTVEIANTDAEGRLVLADAISYVVKNYKPARLIDIATLTGACVVALGNDYTGLVSTNDEFCRQLIRASNETDDRAWRLPNYLELRDSVKSEIADIRNTGFPKGAGGAITAAEFLRQFTDGTAWAHLDVAGTAFTERPRLYYGYGGTGAGVRLLTAYLKNN